MTTPVIIDRQLDTQGGGAYRKVLNAGTQPSEIHTRVEGDADPGTVSIDQPASSEDGTSIRLGADGVEVSKVTYDKRRKLSRIFVTRQFNTKDASRINGVVDGKEYEEDAFQDYSFQQILQFLIEASGGEVAMGSIPSDFSEYAGGITFDKEPITSAIEKVVRKRGNCLWEVTFEGTLKVYERKPGSGTVGQFGVNVMAAEVSGADGDLTPSVRVTDRGNGRKRQYGGSGFLPGSTEQKYDADEPKELVAEDAPANLTDWKYVNGFSSQPKDGTGKPIVGRFTWKTENPFGNGRQFASIDQNFLSHPELRPFFEIERGTVRLSQHEEIGEEDTKTEAQAKGAIEAELRRNYGSDGTVDFYSTTFKKRKGDKDITITRFAGVLWVPRKFTLTSSEGWAIDAHYGRLIYRAQHGIEEIASVEKSNSTVSWVTTPDKDFPTAGAENPVLAVRHSYVHGESKIRGHFVLSTPITPVDLGAAPFNIVEMGDYEEHENVIFNASKNPKYPPPAKALRNDVERMGKQAANLKALNTGLALASGTVTLFPGDEGLQIGQATNGGVITRIEHTYSPYFYTRISLSGQPDVDNPREAELQRAINNLEHEVGINSRDVLSVRDALGDRPSGTTTVPSHDHSSDYLGGQRLGDVKAVGVTVTGQTENEESLFRVTAEGTEGGVAWIYVPEIAKFITLSRFNIDRKPEGKTKPAENKSSLFTQEDSDRKGYAHQLFQLLDLGEVTTEDGEIRWRVALNIDDEKGLQNVGGDRLRFRDMTDGSGVKEYGRLDARVSKPIFLVTLPEIGVTGEYPSRMWLAAADAFENARAWSSLGLYAGDGRSFLVADLSNDEAGLVARKPVGHTAPKFYSPGYYLGVDPKSNKAGDVLWKVGVEDVADPSHFDLLSYLDKSGHGYLSLRQTDAGVEQGSYSKGADSAVTWLRANEVMSAVFAGDQKLNSHPYAPETFLPPGNGLTGSAGWYASIDDGDWHVRLIRGASGGGTGTGPSADGFKVRLGGNAVFAFDSDGWLYTSVNGRRAEMFDYLYTKVKINGKNGDEETPPETSENQACGATPTSILKLKNSKGDVLETVAIPVVIPTKHPLGVNNGYTDFLTKQDWEEAFAATPVSGSGMPPDYSKASQHEGWGIETGHTNPFIGVRGGERNWGPSNRALPSLEVPRFWTPCSDEEGEEYAEEAGSSVQGSFGGSPVGSVGFLPGKSPEPTTGKNPNGTGWTQRKYRSGAKWVEQAFSAVRLAHNGLVAQSIFRDRLIANLAASVWGEDDKNASHIGYSIWRQLWGVRNALPGNFSTREDMASFADAYSYEDLPDGKTLDDLIDFEAFESRSVAAIVPMTWLGGQTIQEKIEERLSEIMASITEVIAGGALVGPQGERGPRGAQGKDGLPGIQGEKGPKGDPAKLDEVVKVLNVQKAVFEGWSVVQNADGTLTLKDANGVDISGGAGAGTVIGGAIGGLLANKAWAEGITFDPATGTWHNADGSPATPGSGSIGGVLGGILSNLGKTVGPGGVVLPGGSMAPGESVHYGPGGVKTPVGAGETVPFTPIEDLQRRLGALESKLEGGTTSTTPATPTTPTTPSIPTVPAGSIPSGLRGIITPQGAVYYNTALGWVKVSTGPTGLAGPALGGVSGNLAGKCGSTFDGAAEPGSGPGALVTPGEIVGVDGAYYYPPSETSSQPTVVQLAQGDTAPASTTRQFFALARTLGFEVEDMTDPGGVVFNFVRRGVESFWRTEPSTSKFREVEAVAAGTGVNSGDWDWLGTTYFDASAEMPWKMPVRVAATTNITKTATQTIDGVSLAVGDRVLLTAQTAGQHNGIWIVASGAWTRAPDLDTADEFFTGISVHVAEGTVGAGKRYYLTTTGAIVVDTTVQTWVVPSIGVPTAFIQRTVLTNTAGGTHTPNASAVWCHLIAVGAGGGGAGAAQGGSQAGVGGGGGSGGIVDIWFPINGNITWDVGAGGIAGTAGNNPGGAGGDTTASCTGMSVTAKGGAGGSSMAAGTSFLQAVGGTVVGGTTGGDTNTPTGQGHSGVRFDGTLGLAGDGADCGPYGRGGAGGQVNSAGLIGGGHGSGGGGAMANGAGGIDKAGGPGADGLIIIEEYY